MDKNIAAFLQQGTKTVKVQFSPTSQHYTYVTDLDLQVNDLVAVPVCNAQTAPMGVSIARVFSIDDDLDIEPNSDKKIKWVIAKLDMNAFEAREERNKAIESTVAKAYRQNLQRSFAEQVMAALPDKTKKELSKLLNPKN